MMKKAMSLLLALVMCVVLSVPVSAQSVELPDTDAAASVVSPRYPLYKMPFTLYMGSLTRADMIFSVSYKGGNYFFEDVLSVSFNNIDTSGIYCNVTSYSCILSSTVCTLVVTRAEMFGDAPTGFVDQATFTIPIEVVVGNARESGPAVVSSVSVVEETYGIRMTAEGAVKTPMRRAD